MDDLIEDMIYDIREDYFRKSHVYDNLCGDQEQPLHSGAQSLNDFQAAKTL